MSALLKQFKNLASPSGLRLLWSYLRAVPGGGKLLGRMLGMMARYTGTIRPEVLALETGFAKARILDRPALRNHLNSVHAIALMNLAEATTGLAMMYSMPDGTRGIPVHLEIDYAKKARGPITAECSCAPISSTERKEYTVQADLTNEAGELVARATARWMVGPA
jgi:acyl-coenzyme A thioesterase PaaI-like protein